MKVLFMGTPQFAVQCLNSLLNSKHQVVGVVTQPDRAVKRGKVEEGAVKTAAIKAGLKVIQPQKIKNCVDEIKSFGADIGVTAAFGQILNSEVLNAFPLGVINVHASLLPKYRGASPIQSAIMCGETQTGVTIMRTELGLDCGDILCAQTLDIGQNESAGELSERLSELGGRLLVYALDNFNSLTPTPQNDSEATHCRVISKAETVLDFSCDAQIVVNKIRSLSPSPCAKTFIDGEQYKIYSAVVTQEECGSVGEVFCTKDEMKIVCGSGAIAIKTIQAPGKRALGVAEFLRGKKFRQGVICAKQAF